MSETTHTPLHHKFRPAQFDQLVGQPFIATTLTQAVTKQLIAPAYLFHGPRGTGKTSTARILAKSLNCLTYDVPTPTPCGNCEVCRAVNTGTSLDVYEVDAASNNGVDFARDLTDRSHLRPIQGRYKVYVIDEAHMLTTQAQNALLKTLEEPPDRVVFVLATTDPDRLLDTIRSRCQSYRFRGLSVHAIVGKLQSIAKAENIHITDEALTQVAIASNGGLRDAESLLGTLATHDHVDTDTVLAALGSIPTDGLVPVVEAVLTNNPREILLQARHLVDDGYEPADILSALTRFYRDLLVMVATQSPDLLLTANTTMLTQVSQSTTVDQVLHHIDRLKTAEYELNKTGKGHHRIWLDMVLVQMASAGNKTPVSTPVPVQTTTAKVKPVEALNGRSIPSLGHISIGDDGTTVDDLATTYGKRAVAILEPPTAETTGVDLDNLWGRVIDVVQPRTIVPVLRQAQLVAYTGSEALLRVSSKALSKTLAKQLNPVEQALATVTNNPCVVRVEG